ncbi:hypothetical protein [Providencia manganoxydans]|uniref:hypothetical protein n=1 Tax=Providencia manganoxydans TaxID=2923283 RepID=UPI0034DCD24E
MSGFWAPLDGGPNEDEALLKLNLNNHSSIDLIVDKILKPYIDMLPLKYKIRFKDSFKYAIAYYSEKELKDCYYTGASQLDLPDGITARIFIFMYGISCVRTKVIWHLRRITILSYHLTKSIKNKTIKVY